MQKDSVAVAKSYVYICFCKDDGKHACILSYGGVSTKRARCPSRSPRVQYRNLKLQNNVTTWLHGAAVDKKRERSTTSDVSVSVVKVPKPTETNLKPAGLPHPRE